jgi:hypothetical protein
VANLTGQQKAKRTKRSKIAFKTTSKIHQKPSKSMIFGTLALLKNFKNRLFGSAKRRPKTSKIVFFRLFTSGYGPQRRKNGKLDRRIRSKNGQK